MPGGRLYGREPWDPRKILTQILVLQVLYYMSFGVTLYVLAFFAGCSLDTDHLFSARHVHFSSKMGWLVTGASLATAFAGALFLMQVVERAKKCLDFAFTQYFGHFLAVVVYQGFPTEWQWWLVQGVCVAVMSALGERLCLRREMQDISVDDIMRSKGKAFGGTPAGKGRVGGSGATSGGRGAAASASALASAGGESEMVPLNGAHAGAADESEWRGGSVMV